MTGNSFAYRVALLLGLMTVISLADLYRNGRKALKFREYGFVLIAGVLGAVVGFCNDLITSSISPDYFILGKGLDDGPGLRLQAGLLGLRVGFSAGIIGGAVCLYATQRKTAYPPAKFSRLLLFLWMPLAAAVLCGILVPILLSRFDPAHLAAQLGSMIDTTRIERFLQVWWIHIGLYTGMIIGLAAMMLRLGKERKSLAAVFIDKNNGIN